MARSGGTQRVIVQHVTVSEGGQAVVAGQVETARPAGSSFISKHSPVAAVTSPECERASWACVSEIIALRSREATSADCEA